LQENNSQTEIIWLLMFENGRYHGEYEPIDLVAGHSWCNQHSTTNLNKTGNFTPVELKQNIKKFLEQQKMENIISDSLWLWRLPNSFSHRLCW
jgi:hypothetical protein